MGSPPQVDESTQSKGEQTDANKLIDVGATFEVQRLQSPLDKMTRTKTGKRSYTKTDRKRGRYIQARPAKGRLKDVAFDATLRAAAPHQKTRDKGNRAFAVERQDIQEKVRVRRTANLVLFAVDASWSMAASERMEATKGAIMSLLMDAYQRRDQVGLVVFQKEQARLILPPTSSVELAKQALKDIPVGGKTPLSAGLYLSHQVITRHRNANPELRPIMILLTDGAGNVSLSKLPAQDEAHLIARAIHDDDIRSVVINMEHPSFDRGLANNLAIQLDAPCYSLGDLNAENIYETVKEQLR